MVTPSRTLAPVCARNCPGAPRDPGHGHEFRLARVSHCRQGCGDAADERLDDVAVVGPDELADVDDPAM